MAFASNFILKVVVFIATGFFCCCFLFLRYFFGTYSIPESLTIFKKVKSLEAKYTNLFNQRDNTEYHIGCARSHGDLEEMRRLMKTLDVIDDDLDSLEREIKMWKEHRGHQQKSHHL